LQIADWKITKTTILSSIRDPFLLLNLQSAICN